ncbi:hypothetical protein RCL1_001460 [Eukaryota sp. TZLM3-RCL]
MSCNSNGSESGFAFIRKVFDSLLADLPKEVLIDTLMVYGVLSRSPRTENDPATLIGSIVLTVLEHLEALPSSSEAKLLGRSLCIYYGLSDKKVDQLLTCVDHLFSTLPLAGRSVTLCLQYIANASVSSGSVTESMSQSIYTEAVAVSLAATELNLFPVSFDVSDLATYSLALWNVASDLLGLFIDDYLMTLFGVMITPIYHVFVSTLGAELEAPSFMETGDGRINSKHAPTSPPDLAGYYTSLAARPLVSPEPF